MARTTAQRPVKSLLISSAYYPPDIGGISKFMSSMVSALGLERVCCLTGVQAGAYRDEEASGVSVYRRPLAFSSSKYVQAVGWGAAVAEVMMRERPQVVQLATLYEGHMGMWMRKWMRLPYVIYAHGNEILDAMQAQWAGHRLALRSADGIFANSRFTVALLTQAGVQTDRIEVIHPGCDVGKFRPIPLSLNDRESILGLHAAAKVILSVGRLVKRKGHDLMVRALPRVLKDHPDTCYLVVGNGPAKSLIENLAVEVGVRHKVIFVENAQDLDLPRLYNLCDVFVMPSREDLEACDVEGFGIVFLEANACGKPVIAGRSGGMADAVVDGKTGILIPPDNPEALAESVSRMLENPTYARRLGQRGRERVENEFTWEAVANRVDRIMMGLTADKGRMFHPEKSVQGDGAR